MLTRQQIQILEQSWEILDKLRGCRSFNESHDLSVGDACQVLSEFLDWQYERERFSEPRVEPNINLSGFESFNRL